VTIDWTGQLLEQLTWHWDNQLRPRFAGLTDDEYLWEPVPGCWSVRPKDESPDGAGGGAFRIDFRFPAPDPAPVTTIAWRLAHITVGVFGQRAASHFGGPPMPWDTVECAGTAAEALDQLDETYRHWTGGVRGLDAAALAAPCGPAEGPFADLSMAALILHIHREAIHHGAEISLLRDLYLRQG
jgi:DinB family protein